MSRNSSSPTRRSVLAASAAAGAVSLLPLHWPQRAKHAQANPRSKEIPRWATKRRNPSLLFPCSGSGARRLAQAHQRDQVARAGTGHGRIARRAARDDAEARALLGDRARLAQGARRSSTPCRNFITEIDGLDIHFIHVRSKHENALPMIVTHGWPGSIIEQMKIIEPLTNPTAHGGTAADAFHLVIPSLPGYGFSGKPTAPGWNPVSIAKAWATLMQRLGYTKYVAQGGDWGNAVSEVMALQQPPGLLGIHTNMAATVPARCFEGAFALGGPPPAGLSPDEKHAWDQLDDFYKNGLGYALEMTQPPADALRNRRFAGWSCGWMLDHDIRSYQMIARVFDGKPEGLTPDDVLDNITLYWLTNTAISSARLYWDTRHNLAGRRLLRCERRQDSGRRERVCRRDLPGAEELGREGVSEAHPLQQASQRHALRGLGTAGAVRVRDARDLQIASFGVTMRRTARGSGARRAPQS